MTPLHRAWTDGVIQGLREYAWMEGDIQYVGKPHTYECRPLVEAERLAEAVWAKEEDDGARMMRWDPAKARYEEVPQ